MANRADVAKGREIVGRWCALAEARLEHLTELFETGRWRRYHSERAFLENIREAKAAVETWRNLLTREASLDNSPIDLSWLSRGTTALARRDVAPERAAEREPQPAALIEPAMRAVSAALETATAMLEKAPTVAEAAPVLDLAAIHARYPLLRNTL